MKPETKAVNIDRNIGDFHYKVDYAKDAGSGLSEKTIHYISDAKEDPDCVREFRLRGRKTFLGKPLPTTWAIKVSKRMISTKSVTTSRLAMRLSGLGKR